MRRLGWKEQGISPLLSIRIPADLRERLIRFAKRRGIKLSDAVRLLLEDGLKRKPRKGD